MTTEDDFQRALDANPDDHNTRMVFADWLEEHGDPRAEGYRALGRNRLCPYVHNPDPMHKDQFRGAAWWSPSARVVGFLPPDWFREVTGFGRDEAYRPLLQATTDIASRWQMDDAAALAFAKLPPHRRAELLAEGGRK